MKKIPLAFCDCSVMERWTVHMVAQKTKRRCLDNLSDTVSRDVQILRSLQAAGVKLTCTITAAAHIVTKFYKGRPAFTGDVEGFPLRKSLARHAAGVLRSSVKLLSPVLSHFELAEGLWLELCDKQVRESYAQFEDYIEAALVLSPPEGTVVTQVLVSHHHLRYLLNKKQSSALIHVLGAWGW